MNTTTKNAHITPVDKKHTFFINHVSNTRSIIAKKKRLNLQEMALMRYTFYTSSLCRT
jgi:hypothetical protein